MPILKSLLGLINLSKAKEMGQPEERDQTRVGLGLNNSHAAKDRVRNRMSPHREAWLTRSSRGKVLTMLSLPSDEVPHLRYRRIRKMARSTLDIC